MLQTPNQSGACLWRVPTYNRRLVTASVTRVIDNVVVLSRIANALFTSFKKVGTRFKRAAEWVPTLAGIIPKLKCNVNCKHPRNLVLACGEYLLTIEDKLQRL